VIRAEALRELEEKLQKVKFSMDLGKEQIYTSIIPPLFLVLEL